MDEEEPPELPEEDDFELELEDFEEEEWLLEEWEEDEDFLAEFDGPGPEVRDSLRFSSSRRQ